MRLRAVMTVSLAMLVAGPLAGVALAGTLSYREVEGLGYHMSEPIEETLVYTAAPGETNLVTVTTSANTTTPASRAAQYGADMVLVHDAGAPVIIGPGASPQCQTVDANTASCPVGAISAPDVGPGGGTLGPEVDVFAGDGNDVVTAVGPGSVMLDGGAGEDRLIAGAGPALLRGGPGNNVLIGSTGGADTFYVDGRAGESSMIMGRGAENTLEYDGRLPFTANLLSGRAGVPGERDTITDIQNVTGGQGPNMLIGDQAANVLVGGPGPDVIQGNGGGDTIDLSLTRSFTDFDGFQTDVRVPDNAPDRVRCGSPRDVVISPGRADSLTGCSTAGDAKLDIASLANHPVRVKRSHVVLAVNGVDRGGGSLKPPLLTLAARIGGRQRTIAVTHLKAPGRTSIPLNALGRRALSGARALDALVTVSRVDTYDDSGGSSGNGGVALRRSIAFNMHLRR